MSAREKRKRKKENKVRFSLAKGLSCRRAHRELFFPIKRLATAGKRAPREASAYGSTVAISSVSVSYRLAVRLLVTVARFPGKGL